jgi:hypothetical protein
MLVEASKGGQLPNISQSRDMARGLCRNSTEVRDMPLSCKYQNQIIPLASPTSNNSISIHRNDPRFTPFRSCENASTDGKEPLKWP